jgi:hypothetical protein
MEGDPRDGVESLLADGGAGEALARVPRPDGIFTVWPPAAQIDWHLERERIYSDLFGRPRPNACGAKIQDGVAVWCAEYGERALTILLLHASSKSEAQALFACARRIAAMAGLEQVTLWKTPQRFHPTEATIEDRLDKLNLVPMIRSLNGQIKPIHWEWIPRAI